MIGARKLDLIEKARGIFTAEGYEIRRVGLAIDIMRNGDNLPIFGQILQTLWR